jgi:hypothetical protein
MQGLPSAIHGDQRELVRLPEASVSNPIQAFVAALVRGQGAAVRLFERVDGRQHEGGPEAAGEPAECARPEARLEARDTGVAATKLTPPIFGMCAFDGSEPAIDLGELSSASTSASVR